MNKNQAAWDFEKLSIDFDVYDLLDWGFEEAGAEIGAPPTAGGNEDPPVQGIVGYDKQMESGSPEEREDDYSGQRVSAYSDGEARVVTGGKDPGVPNLEAWEQPETALRIIIKFDNHDQLSLLVNELGLIGFTDGRVMFHFKDTRYANNE